MKKLLILIMLLVSVAGVSGAKYAFFGTSILALGGASSVPNWMMYYLNNGSTYANLAVGGATYTYYDSLKIDSIINAENPDYVVVEYGINDIRGNRLTPQDQIRYLNRFYAITAAHGKQMILAELLPSWDSYQSTDGDRKRIYYDADIHNKYRRKWAFDRHVLFIPTWTKFQNSARTGIADSLFSDGIHPSATGNDTLGKIYTQYAYLTSKPNIDTLILKNGYPLGTQFVKKITANKTYIKDSTSFVYEYNASSLLSNPLIKSKIKSVNNILVYDSVNFSWKYADLDTASNYLWIHFKSSIDSSKAVGKRFFICIGDSILNSNSRLTYNNDSISNNWNFDDHTVYTKTFDNAGKTDLTVVGSNATLKQLGKIGYSGRNANDGNSVFNGASSDSVFGIGNRTISFLTKLSSNKTYNTFIHNGRFVINVNATGTFAVYSNGATASVYNYGGALDTSAWYHIAVTRKSTGNALVYVNGIAVGTEAWTGTPAYGTFNFGVTGWGPTAAYPLNGYIDNVRLYSVINTPGKILTESNMLLQSGFWSSDSTITVSSTTGSSRWDAFKASTKPAYKKTWK